MNTQYIITKTSMQTNAALYWRGPQPDYRGDWIYDKTEAWHFDTQANAKRHAARLGGQCEAVLEGLQA